MKMFKRIYTSIKRKPFQMLLVFLIVFVLGNVLFASIAIKQSSEHVKEEMQDRISSEIVISLRDDVRQLRAYKTFMNRMNLFVDELSLNEDILDMKAWSQLTWRDGFKINALFAINNENEMIGQLNLIEGRLFEREDFGNDRFEIILTYPIENYEIGDIFQMPIYDYDVKEEGDIVHVYKEVGEYFEFEIIGIADGYSRYYDEDFNAWGHIVAADTLNRINEIYKNKLLSKPLKFKSILERYFDAEAIPEILRIEIETEGIETVEKLEKEIKHHGYYANSIYSLETLTSEYRYIQAPVENLVALANVTLVASAFLIVVILGLVSVFFIRNRKQEIGLLMALGERKIKVLGQFVLELLIVGLLATSAAMVSGNKLGALISDSFMRIQIDAENELKYQQQDYDALTQLDVLDAYKVELDAEYILSIYSIATLILLISSTAPVIFILKMQPKKVLL